MNVEVYLEYFRFAIQYISSRYLSKGISHTGLDFYIEYTVIVITKNMPHQVIIAIDMLHLFKIFVMFSILQFLLILIYEFSKLRIFIALVLSSTGVLFNSTQLNFRSEISTLSNL